MHVDWKFTGDGLLAFAGGTLALFGVWLSNRRSVRNIQMQIDTEKQAEDDKQEAERQALATALLFEIDHFYRAYLTTTLTLVRGTAGKNVDSGAALALSVAMRIEPAPFDIYQGNTGRLGSLGLETARSVIRFYQIASDLKDDVRRYLNCLSGGHESRPFTAAIEAISLNLKVGALETCSWLCQTADLPFDSTDIAVASEITQIKELATSKGIPIRWPEGLGQAGR
ncbi:MAG: hypothetical protein ACRD1J_08970 [Terriglobia bacterium]